MLPHTIKQTSTGRALDLSYKEYFIFFVGMAMLVEVLCLCMQEFLQALAIIADECGMELIDAAVQLGADPAYLQGNPPTPLSFSLHYMYI